MKKYGRPRRKHRQNQRDKLKNKMKKAMFDYFIMINDDYCAIATIPFLLTQ